MITSKQVLQISEDYLKNTRSGLMMPTPIFVDPTSTDFKELYRDIKSHEVRFIIDNKLKRVYVWDANSALHGMVAREVGVYNQFNKIHPEDLLVGSGIIRNGKVYMNNSDTIETIIRLSFPESDDKDFLSKLVNTNWSWASRYVDCTEFLNKIKNILKKWQ